MAPTTGLSEAQVTALINAQTSNLSTLIRQLQGRMLEGTGSPENVVAAPPGTLYVNTNGGLNTTLYVKESGTGDTGWIAK